VDFLLKLGKVLLVLLLITMTACTKKEKVETHQLPQVEIKPVTFSGDLAELSDKELLEYGRTFLSIFAQALPTRNPQTLENINDTLYEQGVDRPGIIRFTLDRMLPLKNADKYKEVKVDVANETIDNHEHWGTFDYKYDIKVVGILEDGTEDILLDDENYRFEIIKNDHNELKVHNFEAMREVKGASTNYGKIIDPSSSGK
jgi:hypothetical protein